MHQWWFNHGQAVKDYFLALALLVPAVIIANIVAYLFTPPAFLREAVWRWIIMRIFT